jgi:hypothetical protein
MVTPETQVINKSSVSSTAKNPIKSACFSGNVQGFYPFTSTIGNSIYISSFFVSSLYSTILLRLPIPFSLTTKMVLFLSSLFTHNNSHYFIVKSSTSIPLTPMAPLPVGRTLASGKRIARPDLTAIMI